MRKLLGLIGVWMVAILLAGGLITINVLLYTLHWVAGTLWIIFFVGLGLAIWGTNKDEDNERENND